MGRGPGRLQYVGLQRVRHTWATEHTSKRKLISDSCNWADYWQTLRTQEKGQLEMGEFSLDRVRMPYLWGFWVEVSRSVHPASWDVQIEVRLSGKEAWALVPAGLEAMECLHKASTASPTKCTGETKWPWRSPRGWNVVILCSHPEGHNYLWKSILEASQLVS